MTAELLTIAAFALWAAVGWRYIGWIDDHGGPDAD